MNACLKEGDHLLAFLVIKFVYTYTHMDTMDFPQPDHLYASPICDISGI